MSEYSRIEKHLAESFEDFKLSKEEKYSLRSLLENLSDKDEILSFARNKAFDIYRDHQSVELDNFLHAVNWLERVIKTIDGVRVDTSIATPSAHFSPGDACAKQIINCLLTARDSIDICVFTISDNQITDAILSAHEKGKGVRIISDNDKANDRGSDIYYLAEKGVPVRLDQSPYHMHHKFAIFDQKLLINGSFNWTRSASLKNEENITILHEPSLIDSFVLSFEELWLESKDV
jgi:phosphatidylserine/phosphatidylglycerophosphate/cardiolipin synthase-like enzyme